MPASRLLLILTHALLLTARSGDAATAADWNFTRGTQGWVTNGLISQARITTDGLEMETKSPDPNLTGPVIDLPANQFVLVTVRMRSTADALGQLYYGVSFSEERSRTFSVTNDGKWHDYRIPVPPLGPGVRFRLDPCRGEGQVTLARVHVETSSQRPWEPWASPRELRSKKMIGSGQYTTTGGDKAITSRFLATHPHFTESYPFDGLVLPAVLDAEWSDKMGLRRRDYFLHEIVWNTVPVPPEAIAATARELNSVRWAGVTDNFLNYTLIDGARGRNTPDLTSDRDWAILEHNAAMAARLCREAKLQGFWLDTEQYGNYRWRNLTGVPEFDTNRPANLKFPLGKDTPEVLRRRGAQWIKAVQAELPQVKIIITFAWSPDAESYGPLKGAHGFLDGVLDAIQAPAQLIHGYENTFYYGQGPGTTYTQDGFPGDRGRYEAARALMRSWRSFSSNPARYDLFLKIGMAAWVEDDPWNVWAGFPSGQKSSFWSNLPLALAYSDEYVWIWSEHTQYGQDQDSRLNPFLASLCNQTFNTGQEAVPALVEDFSRDPMGRGWHFDFDMLAIGRKKDPSHAVPLMNTETLPYVWNRTNKALVVRGECYPGANGQRRRYVRPIQPVDETQPFHAELDFQVDHFGEGAKSPIVLGLFSSEKPLNLSSLTLQIMGPNQAQVVVTGTGEPQSFPVSVQGGLKIGKPYRVTFAMDGKNRRLEATLREPPQSIPPLAQIQSSLPSRTGTETSYWDELGIALRETDVPPSTQAPYRYQITRAAFHR